MENKNYIDWQYRGEYIESRSTRRPGDTDIKIAWANEAYYDKNAVVQDPDVSSKSGRSIRTIGFSPSAGFPVSVITIKDEGVVIGVNAWKSNKTDANKYDKEDK
jgi:hypothetical protein